MSDVAAAEPLELGRVARGTWDVLRANFAPLFAISLVLSGVPGAALQYVQAQNLETEGVWWSTFAMIFGGVVFNALAAGGITYATLEDRNGRRAGLGSTLAVGFRMFPAVVGASLAVTIGMMFGMALLVVPGLIMACAWFVVVPVLLSERVSIFGSLDRSRDLTRGNRLRLFGLMLVYYVALAALLVPLELVSPAASGEPLSLAVGVLSTAVGTLITSVGAAVTYVELRRLREGVVFGLAEVFA